MKMNFLDFWLGVAIQVFVGIKGMIMNSLMRK
jgi:hypothetical protein